MQLPFFYDVQAGGTNGVVGLSPENSKYIVQVLRMVQGERIILTDGAGTEAIAEITAADKKQTHVAIIERKVHPKSGVKHTIGISLLKNESRLEWFVEKATELGISKIILLVCDHTEKRSCRVSRLQNIMVSAMLQSRQFFLPVLAGPMSLKEVINESGYTLRLIAHCMEERSRILLSDANLKESSLLLIGPEGDFSPKEVETFELAGFTGVSLGENRLRTETAGIASAVLMVN